MTESDSLHEFEIWTKNLTKIYKNGKKSVTAVDSINLSVKPGIHGFLGPNGAGKTTTINMLIGALSITKGEALIRGKKAGTIFSNQLIGFLPQDPQFYEDMSGLEYLIYVGQLGGLSKENSIQRSNELLKYFDIFDSKNREIGKYSGGMKQKIGIAAALIHKPHILILDEPTANLDPIGRQSIINKIKELSSEISVFVSSHILAEIEQMCSRVTMINHGKIIIDDELDNIKKEFIGNIFLLETDKNEMILEKLKSDKNIKRIWLEKEKDGAKEILHIDPEDVLKLQKSIPHLLIETDAILYSFNQPEISLQDIFMMIMDSSEKKQNNKEEQL